MDGTASLSPFPAECDSLRNREKRLLIDGEWVPSVSGATFPTVNPSNGLNLADVSAAAAQDVDLAVHAARRALDGPWAAMKPFDRQRLLLATADLVERHYEELAQLDSLEYGGPITSTLASGRRAVALLRYYAGLATTIRGSTVSNSLPGDVFSYTVKEPVGVVAAITPWNRPVITAIWKVAPALAAGCTVVLKPSEEASLAPLRFAELMMEAGLPPGVLNVVTGGPEVGAALVEHPGVDKVAFTGSTATGQAIIRSSANDVKRLSLELGGKSANIVFADADLDLAVPAAAMAVFGNTGQLCIAGSRLFVEAAVYDEFVSRVAEFGKRLKVGDSLDPTVDLGPLVSERQRTRVEHLIASGVDQGAELISGGGRLGGELADGYFVEPAVFGRVRDDMRIAQEEIFGPVVSALPFSDVGEVVRRANQLRYGLAAGVWSRDVGKAQRVARALDAGTVWVNSYLLMDPEVPFGGRKRSGYGLESGTEHLEEFLETKSVYVPLPQD